MSATRRINRRTTLRAAGLLPLVAATAALPAGCASVGDALGNAFSINTVRVGVGWSGDELAAFHRMLDDFHPHGYSVQVLPLGDQIRTALSPNAKSRPEVVMLPTPGLIHTNLQYLDPLPADLWSSGNLGLDWQAAVSVNGVPYGLPFKLTNRSAVWYRADLIDRVPTSWSDWLALNDRLIGRGTAPLALAGADGWPLADFLSNILLTVSPGAYTQLTGPRPNWSDPALGQALRTLGAMWSVPGAISGGAERALEMRYPDALLEVFGYHRAAMVVAPDHAEPVIRRFRRDPASIGVFPFPGTGDNVVSGGDIAVLRKPAGDQANDFVRWLAGPQAPMSWINGNGGFLAANPRSDNASPGPNYTANARRLLAKLRHSGGPYIGLFDGVGSAYGTSLERALADFLRTVGDGGRRAVDQAARTVIDTMTATENGSGG